MCARDSDGLLLSLWLCLGFRATGLMSSVLQDCRDQFQSYLWTGNWVICPEAALLLPFSGSLEVSKGTLSSNWQTRMGLHRYPDVSEGLEGAQNGCQPGWLRTHTWFQGAARTCQHAQEVSQRSLQSVPLVRGGPRWLCLQSHFRHKVRCFHEMHPEV